MFLKLFFRIFFVLSLLIFSYVIFKSEFILKGNIREYYYIYYILSAGLVLFSVITFFFNYNLKLYTCIVLITVFITLYTFEIYLTLRDPQKISLKSKIYKNKTGKLFDKRSKYEIYNELKLIEKNIVVSVLPNVHYQKNNIQNIFPLSGISKKKTIECNELGYYSIYESDRYGFNNPDYVWDENEIEYLLIGGSWIHGNCVNRPDDIASRLRMFSGKNVINLGYGGNGPLIELATLREYLPKEKKVKNILWFFYEKNDLDNLNNEIKNKILIKYLENKNFKQNLISRQNEVDKIGEKVIENEKSRGYVRKEKRKISYQIVKSLKLYSTRQVILSKKNRKKNIHNLEINNILKKIFYELKMISKKHNSNLIIFIIPGNNKFKNLKYSDNDLKLIKKIFIELDIEFFDIYDEFFKNKKNPLKYFPFGFDLNGHYNVNGYNELSKEIYKYSKK